MMGATEYKIWEYWAGVRSAGKYRGYTIAKTEFTAIKNAKIESGVDYLEFHVIEIPITGYKIVKRGEDENDRAGEAKDS